MTTYTASWREYANCATSDPEVFYPPEGGSNREAKKVCLGCGVREECLQYAVDNAEPFGIWGGLSADDRKRLRRSRRVKAAA